MNIETDVETEIDMDMEANHDSPLLLDPQHRHFSDFTFMIT